MMKTNIHGYYRCIRVMITLLLYVGTLNAQHIQIDTIASINYPALEIVHAAADGIDIKNTGGSGIKISKTAGPGIFIDSAGWDGLRIVHGSRGVLVIETEGNAFEVVSAGNNAYNVIGATQDGFVINDAGRYGFAAETTGGDGVHIVDAGGDGVHIDECNDDGLYVGHAEGNGIRVANADEYSMDIQGTRTGLASVENHIARLQNFNSGSGGDVLAIKVSNSDDPDHTSNFITFFKGGPDNSINNALGAIEGNGSGGITFKTNGADFAEALPQLYPDEIINPGDVVGVYQGKISLQTKGADQVMVITDRPAILGNGSEQLENTDSGNVSFIGQVPVRVQGPVKSGDWLVQSGKREGTARVLDAGNMKRGDQIIGQAWENVVDSEIRKINVAIGIGHQQIYQQNLMLLKEQIAQQQIEIESLKNQMKEIINQIK